jgi:sulfate adenylyltransferase subunit 1
MNWYQNAPLLHTLETIHISSDHNIIDARFPVQTVLRPQRDEFIDYRGYAGRVSSGIFRVGDDVKILPSGFQSKIKGINFFDKQIETAFSQMSVAITLEDDIDISRGNMLVKINNLPKVTQDITAMLCWFNEASARPKAKYVIKHTTNDQKALIKEVVYKVDINTFKRIEDNKDLNMNDICKVKIRTTAQMMVDEYLQNRSTGGFILVDESTNETVAAGMIMN